MRASRPPCLPTPQAHCRRRVHVAAFGGPSKAAAAEAAVRNFYAAWNAGDAGAAVAGMSDDVEYW